jgi:hypothetical protein
MKQGIASSAGHPPVTTLQHNHINIEATRFLALLPKNGAAAAFQPTLPLIVEDAAKPRLDATARSGGRPQAGSPEASARPLVYREQSFASEAQKRRKRYERRAASSKWLTADALANTHIEPVEGTQRFMDMDTGEMLDSDFVRPPRPARCGWRIGAAVSIHADAETHTAHYSGTEHCGSVWSCPVCSAVIRAQRAEEIQTVIERHQKAGGSVIFLTLTMRHRRSDSLAMLLDALLGSWKRLLQGAAWKRTRRDYELTGYIRATEVTWSESNGWHPHLHCLLLTGRRLDDAEVQRLGDEIHGRWARYVKSATGRMPDREHGVDVQRVDEGGRLVSEYVTALQDEGKHGSTWSASAEMARGDVKKARHHGLVPLELLDDECGLPEPRRRALWLEYAKTTKGRRCITWSHGLKDLFSILEQSDRQIVDDTESVGQLVAVIPADAYDKIRREPATLALLLDMAARGLNKLLPAIAPGLQLIEHTEEELDDE